MEQQFRRVARGFEAYFRDSVGRMVNSLKSVRINLVPDRARADAAQIMSEIFDQEEEYDELLDVAMKTLLPVFVVGIRTQEDLFTSGKSKSTSAQDIIERLEIDVPAGIAFGPYPDWMIAAATETLGESFEQDYWKKIPQTTRDDVQQTLMTNLEEGGSIRSIANQIMEKHGGRPYTLHRASNVARTECLPGHIRVGGANITAGHRRTYSGQMVEIVTDLGVTFSATPNHPMLTTRGWVAIGKLQETDYLIGDGSHVKLPGATGNVNVNAPPPTIAEVLDTLSAVGIRKRSTTGKPDFHGDGGHGDVDVFSPDGILPIGKFASITQCVKNDGFKLSGFAKRIVLDAHRQAFAKSVDSRNNGRFRPTSSLFSKSIEHISYAAFRSTKVLSDFRRRITAAVHFNDFVFAVPQGEFSHSQLCGFGLVPVDVSTFAYPGNSVCPDCKQVRYSDGGLPLLIEFRNFLLSGFVEPIVVPVSASVSFDSSGLTNRGYGFKADAKTVGNGLLCKPVVVELDDLPSDPVAMSLHRVTSIRSYEFTGPVHNLSTEEGYFIAEGLFTGNTTTALNAGHYAGIGNLQDETGIPMGVEWLSIRGNTTRESHAELDGVVVPHGGRFNLGGVMIKYPGDIALPAKDRCN